MEIQHIDFPYLHTLILQRTNIESIETINRISMPKLASLNLSIIFLYKDENKLTKIGMMRKEMEKFKMICVGKFIVIQPIMAFLMGLN